MKKEHETRSLASRLTRRIVLILLVILVPLSIFTFMIGDTFAVGDEDLRHIALLDESVESVSSVLSEVYVGTVNHVPEIEESLEQPDRLPALMQRIVTLNPRIRSCGLSFVENYYPQKGRTYMPYAVRTDSTHVEVQNFAKEVQGYLQEDWFLEALAAKEVFWSKPFFEGNDTITPLVACLVPIHNKQGQTVAVLGADISLSWLMKEVKVADKETLNQEWYAPHDREVKKQFIPYRFIIDSDGTFIVHPEEKRILRENISDLVKASPDTATQVIARNMMNGKKGFFSENDEELGYTCYFDGQEAYVFYAPIERIGWSMALVVPESTIDIVGYVVGGLLGVLVLMAILTVLFVTPYFIRRNLKPLKMLADSAGEVAKGNFQQPLPVLKHNDEISLLRDSFEEMQFSLEEYINELKKTTASKAAIENELKVAHDIQMSLLPKKFPPYPERNDIDIFGSLTPAKDVGGDLFDFFIRNNQLFFCIGDVSGKGVPASLVMAVTRSLFRNISAHVSAPNQIVYALNKALIESNDTNMFVTIFVGLLDLNTGHLYYCNAGHEAPLLIGNDLKRLSCDSNLPIAVVEDWEFTLQETMIPSQTTIFLYTDGLSEAENIYYAQFDYERILDTAKTCQAEGISQTEAIVNKMTEAVHSFVGGAKQNDDLTMLAIKYINTNGL